jgi:hypothetical protein
MRFLTEPEAADWARGRSMLLPFGDRPERQPHLPSLRVRLPQGAHRFYGLSEFLARVVPTSGDACLLWMTGYGIWPSSENTHLYYRLRASYGDRRLLHEAPAHLCLKHEREDLATMVQLALLFGWDGYVLPDSDHLAAFCSHDEFVELYSRDANRLEEIKAELFRLDPGLSG